MLIIERNNVASKWVAAASMRKRRPLQRTRKFFNSVGFGSLVFCQLFAIPFGRRSIAKDNKGFKMLAKMGWSQGSALGKNDNGLLEPVC